MEAKINRKLNRLTSDLFGSSKRESAPAKQQSGPAKPVELKVVSPWVKNTQSPPPIPQRVRTKSSPTVLQKAVRRGPSTQERDTSPPTLEVLEKRHQEALARIETAKQKQNLLKEWVQALHRYDEEEQQSAREHKERLRLLAETSQATTPIAHDSAVSLLALQAAVNKAQEQLTAVQTQLRMYEEQCSEARDDCAVTLALLESEEATTMQLAACDTQQQQSPTSLGYTKGASVFAKRHPGAEDTQWMPARIEHAMSTGKYLVVFEESKARAVCELVQLRATLPPDMDALAKRFSDARAEANALCASRLELAKSSIADIPPLATVEEALATATASLRRKEALLDMKSKRAAQQQREQSARLAKEESNLQERFAQEKSQRLAQLQTNIAALVGRIGTMLDANSRVSQVESAWEEGDKGVEIAERDAENLDVEIQKLRDESKRKRVSESSNFVKDCSNASLGS
jgi:hypothetical protein